MIREEIVKLIEKSIKELQKGGVLPKFDILEIQVEHPEEKTHGDYAVNVAMTIAKQVKKSPMEIAQNIKNQISKIKNNIFEKIEVAKPGFINFFLSKEYLQKRVKEILKQGENFGKLEIGKGQKTQVEFISANPTGPLHIGNGRGAFFGDTLANILERAGYKVIREYYVNDARVNTQIKILGQTALGKGTTYLTKNLEFGIKNLESKLKNIKDEGEAGHLLAQEVQRDNKDFIEEKIKIKFDNWVSEEDFYKKNKIDKIFKWLREKNLVYEKDKAWWIKTSKFGDEKDWVVIRETGGPTYLLSDITYHKDKFERGFSKIVNIWGADHQGHVSKIKAVAKILGYKGDLDILISQIVRLKGGLKLSKRKGEIITLESLIDEVGLDVARFLYLTKSLNTQMEFDLELAKEQGEKNPVFYIQYAHARICSILRKCKMQNAKCKIRVPTKWVQNLTLLNHPSELELVKQLIRFPEIIEDTSQDYQVQRIPQYALDLATVFHQFYRDCKVLTEDGPLKEARLSLILATKTILKNTLDLMGISAPERM
ncbi:MAG: arginine--tRNA ligase [Candidatus Nealsonbacteria bacterium CG18_big_fil_WC_8_21_14_2_50_37_10]|uniref:Arginine--tRNA ligase n=1 Tax=Candidatus Nealsonbacteria bacterium CG18_big_fil_WC_8_21_14_2_50_37_10 TaxID=1974717 RepID=A0A2H0FGG0_9BACT|nr:MAG: arginine--tRNA ligase [Candidatus Nealsonbacteria bacterium CG18_big_fil_WC_8_21_14_2_50_37_10]